MTSQARGRPLAVVTGASAGIGRAFAEDLAARGHDLLVVARRRERLDALAEASAGAHGVSVRVEEWDLADEEGLAAAVAGLGALERTPDIVVLNAGFGAHGRLWELDATRQADMARLNCLGVLEPARAVLPGMVAAGHGAVIVISSAAAFLPLPYTAVYAATKAFERSLTRALDEELRGTGVRALAVCPGPTATEFGIVAGTSEMAGSVRRDRPEDVVRATWAALARGRSSVPTGLVARAVGAATALVPERISVRVAAVVQRPRSLEGGRGPRVEHRIRRWQPSMRPRTSR